MQSLRQLECFLLVLVLISGCGEDRSGPPSTDTDSSAFASLSEKVDFLNQYVAFRRTYESLDFDISYHNNGGGMVPGPSEWDIRLVATVPADELNEWIPADVEPMGEAEDSRWLDSVPTSLDLSGINEWYHDHRRIVGIDRERRIVAYYTWAH